MVPTTRRRLLSGAATALLGGLAGCSGSSSSSSSSPPANERTDANPDHVSVRAPDGTPVWLSPADGTTTVTTTASDSRPPRARHREEFVASADAAGRVRFADAATNVSAARSFLDATDYDAATVFLDTRNVPACRELDLCRVGWTNTSVRTDYGSRYRDADAACSADAHEWTTFFVRLPAALDPEEISEFASSRGRGGCRNRVGGAPSGSSGPLDAGPLTNASASTNANASSGGNATGSGE